MQERSTEQDDELSFSDFRQQLQQLRVFLVSLGRLVARSVRRYALLILVLLIGFGIWGYYSFKESKAYEAKASFVYIELQKKTYGEMLDKLQDMVRVGSYKQVAEALQLTEQQAKDILDIRGENLHGARLSEDITEDRKVFYVNVTAKNNTLFDTLQPALEHFLSHNLYLQNLVARRRKILEQKIRYEKAELAMLDSLKLAYTQSLGKATGSVYPSSGQFNPVELYNKSEKINQELADMQTLLDDYRPVQAQDRFMVSEQPNGKSLLFFAGRSLILWVLSCVLIIFVLSIFKK